MKHLNYASNHDGYTLWDRINDFEDKTADAATKVSMDEFSQAIIFTAQGIPEILSGEELLRSKQDSNNSYNAGDACQRDRLVARPPTLPVYKYYAGPIPPARGPSRLPHDLGRLIQRICASSTPPSPADRNRARWAPPCARSAGSKLS